MQSLVLQPDEEGLCKAGELLRAGQLVAFPTETVYGLGANALDEAAARGIFIAKGRPMTDPLIVHVCAAADATPLIDIDGEAEAVFKMLGEAFWPGPLTLIVRAASCVPGVITANTGMVGIRSPSHPIAQQLLQAARVPVAAPSANLFGHVSPTRCEHVLADLGSKGVSVVYGDSPEHLQHTCVHGIESTVAKLDAPKKTVFLLRQGAITRQQILGALRNSVFVDWGVELVVRSVAMVATDANALVECSALNEGELAPGQAITHYAPNIPCVIAETVQIVNSSSGESSSSSSSCDRNMTFSAAELKKTVVLDFGGVLSEVKDHVLAYNDLSPDRDTAVGARSLFLSLRWAEAVPGAEHVILADISPGEGAGAAQFLDSVGPGLADRMQRAASGVRVNVKCIVP